MCRRLREGLVLGGVMWAAACGAPAQGAPPAPVAQQATAAHVPMCSGTPPSEQPTPGNPEHRAIQAVVRTGWPDLAACYQAAAARHEVTAERMDVRFSWTIGVDGVPRDLCVWPSAPETSAPRALVDCMGAVLATRRYAPRTAAEGVAHVTYPFAFLAGKPAPDAPSPPAP
jgi:hypothetical protein